jgi:hypothetical protein
VDQVHVSLICNVHRCKLFVQQKSALLYQLAIKVQQLDFYPSWPFNLIVAQREGNFESMRLIL